MTMMTVTTTTAAPDRGPLPFNALERAARARLDVYGTRRGVRDACLHLELTELQDLQGLLARRDLDGVQRRLRQIAAGTLRACTEQDHDPGLLEKAIAAKALELAGSTAIRHAISQAIDRHDPLSDPADLAYRRLQDALVRAA